MRADNINSYNYTQIMSCLGILGNLLIQIGSKMDKDLITVDPKILESFYERYQ